MCVDPVTAAVIASAALAAGATATEAYTNSQVAKSEEKAFNAEAKAARSGAALEASRFQRRLNAQMSQLLAEQANSGFDSLSGSALEVRARSAGEGAGDRELILLQGEQRARGFLNAAEQKRFQANMALVSGSLGVGGDLLSGFTQFKDLKGGAPASGLQPIGGGA